MFAKILIISLFCEGLNVLLSDGMILGFIRPYVDARLKPQSKLRYILKPIIFCHVCFASFWGTLVYIGVSELFYWPEWIICIVSATFINRLLYNLNERIE